ncbi:MAG: HAMP domain-containing histidine kinase [Actinobacteria bacterium]|nr:HAMP domain-containing histidine kinase [Actinomycetota bacterium]
MAGGVAGPLPEQAERLVDIARSNSGRLVRLINDILDLERIESGRVEMTPAAVPAADLARRAVEELRPVADDAGVTVRVAAAPALVWADPDRVLQTLTNLISNAVKFSDRDNAVDVEVGLVDGEVHFAVRDRGRGIPADKHDTVFGRFAQVDASDAREKGGTGLGLAICRSIVEQHGGRIWVDSTLGHGSVFTFALPVARVEITGTVCVGVGPEHVVDGL